VEVLERVEETDELRIMEGLRDLELRDVDLEGVALAAATVEEEIMERDL
jgi:hypothetical protein